MKKLGQETVARKILEAEGKVITSISLATALRRIKKPIKEVRKYESITD